MNPLLKTFNSTSLMLSANPLSFMYTIKYHGPTKINAAHKPVPDVEVFLHELVIK